MLERSGTSLDFPTDSKYVRMADTTAIRLPKRQRSPQVAAARRIGLAISLILFVALVVRLGRDGYVDVTDDSISFLDSVYYASVTVTTTGYGDITPISDGARLSTIFLVTPARILFLILVVSTTVEVLTEQSRVLLAKRRWRQSVKNHTVICGYGATGHAAARDLVSRGVDPSSIVVVDQSAPEIEDATAKGLVGVVGDATRTDVLEQAGVSEAKSIIIAPNRDDTAVLITLTVREMNPTAHVTVGGREQENLHLLRQGGADEVIDATATIGRMLGIGAHDPGAMTVLGDLLDASQGIELVELTPKELGDGTTVPKGATLVGLIRNGRLLPQSQVGVDKILANDRIIVLRQS